MGGKSIVTLRLSHDTAHAAFDPTDRVSAEASIHADFCLIQTSMPSRVREPQYPLIFHTSTTNEQRTERTPSTIHRILLPDFR